MNLRNVLRAYALLRVLTDDEAALLETLRNANDNERQLIAEAMSDKPQKKPGKGRASKSAGKSKHASGMAAALNRSLESSRKAAAAADVGTAFCGMAGCGEGLTNPIHTDKSYLNYHPFAPSAISPSSPNSVGDSSTASSETGKGAAGSVAQGVSGGD